MRVGNHLTVKTIAGTHKAMKNAARRIPRRRPPPLTAHVLMVKMTVAHRSASGKKKTLNVIVDLLSARNMHSTIMTGKMLTIRISHVMLD